MLRKGLTGLFLCLMGGAAGFAQADTILASFGAVREGNTIRIDWTIEGGSTCNGILVFRSADSVNFTQIGEIPGICGSTTNPVGYTFPDPEPLQNKRNYYRLDLGGYGLTRIISIDFFVLNADNYLLLPHPVTDASTLYFDNPQKNSLQFRLVNESGQVVLEIAEVRSDYLILDRTGIRNGTYIFILLDQGKVIVRGKLVVN